MSMRGVQKHNARMTTSAMHGAFRSNAPTRQEFLDNISVVGPHHYRCKSPRFRSLEDLKSHNERSTTNSAPLLYFMVRSGWAPGPGFHGRASCEPVLYPCCAIGLYALNFNHQDPIVEVEQDVMLPSKTTYIGIDTSGGEHPFTYAALDDNCQLVAMASGESLSATMSPSGRFLISMARRLAKAPSSARLRG